MTDACNHNFLNRLEGPIHPSGTDYVCKDCGEQFSAKKSVISVSLGVPSSNPLAEHDAALVSATLDLLATKIVKRCGLCEGLSELRQITPAAVAAWQARRGK